ncbi:MAG: hypothetical protein ABI822_30365, partial [Bryobacteraceae bacterium]
MDFSGLIKGVQDFWDFIWPPILCLVALVGLTLYIAPLMFSRVLSKAASLRPTEPRQIQFFKAAKRFGFDKLFPIICAFFLIFLLDVVRNIVLMGGQALPPVITYTPSALLLENSSNSMIQCLWKTRSASIYLRQQENTRTAASQKGAAPPPQKDPDPTHLDMRYGFVTLEDISQLIDAAVADAEVQHKDSEPVKSLHYAQERTDTPHLVFSALKFLFLFLLCVSVLELRRSATRRRVVARALLSLGVLILGIVGYLLAYLKATENVAAMKRYVAQAYPITSAMNCDAFDDDIGFDLDTLY